MKNIFYASNAQPIIFPQNSRVEFSNYIDLQDLNYITHENIEVAVKSITFDNNQYIKFEPRDHQPHLVLIQEGEFFTEIFEEKRHKGIKVNEYRELSFEGDGEVHIFFLKKDGAISMEYFTTSSPLFSIRSLYFENCVFHCIYLHQKEFVKNSETSFYLNNVLIQISLFMLKLSRGTSFFYKSSNEWVFKSEQYDVYVREDFGKLFGLVDPLSFSCLMHMNYELKNYPNIELTSNKVGSIMNNLLFSIQTLSYFHIRKNAPLIYVNFNHFKNRLYGVRSNISFPSIRNIEYDKVVTIFKPSNGDDISHIEFKNPLFFKSRKELLSEASFQLIDIEDNKSPEFSFAAPTYIQVSVKKSEMEKHFNIFLDSTCEKSKDLYPNNSSTDFVIELPERLEFNRHWQVTLKSLFLPNKIHNIENCFLSYEEYEAGENGTLIKLIRKTKVNVSGYFPSTNLLINELRDKIGRDELPIRIDIKDGFVKLSSELFPSEIPRQVRLSPYLGYILGYNLELEKDGQCLRFDENSEYISPYKADVNRMFPKNIIIGCDIVDNTIFGGQHIKLLRFVSNSINPNSNKITFDFHQDEYVDLGVRSFKSIHIAIMNVSGDTLKSEGSTQLQLKFSSPFLQNST